MKSLSEARLRRVGDTGGGEAMTGALRTHERWELRHRHIMSLGPSLVTARKAPHHSSMGTIRQVRPAPPDIPVRSAPVDGVSSFADAVGDDHEEWKFTRGREQKATSKARLPFVRLYASAKDEEEEPWAPSLSWSVMAAV